MNKKELKQLINKEFGFAVNKITLLEYYGKDYVMFDVCGVEYQMDYSYERQCYILSVYESCKTVLNVLGR